MESNTFHTYTDSLEMRREHCHSELHQVTKSFWQEHTPFALQQPNPTTMENIMTEIFAHITNRLDCIAKYKRHLLHI